MDLWVSQQWFVGLPQWALLSICAVAVAALIRGADLLVDGASGIAYRLGISKVIVGATVVSLGTTSPECAVSVIAAWTGEPGLALGNAIGSIVADTGLIFGLGCVIAVLPADRFVLSRQGWVQFGAGSLLALLCYASWMLYGESARLERWVGVMLLGLLAVYLWISVRWARVHPEGEPFQMDAPLDAVRKARRSFPALALFVVAGLGVVLLASRVLIFSVTELAEVHWKVPKVVIAATLVALGTSLPELVIGMASIFKGHREILVGNVIGADILNVLFVVGASASAAPLPLLERGIAVPEILLLLHLPAMILILICFRVFIHSACKRGHFARWHGVPLLLLYLVYTIVQYAVG